MSEVIPTIAVIRETNLMTNQMVEDFVHAQQIQFDLDFEPIWNLRTKVIFVPPRGIIPAGAWELVLLDNSDQAGALGYHDDSGPGGVPRSKAFVEDDIDNQVTSTTTFSHENLEMRVDPFINQTAVANNFEYAKEICDADEDDQFAYFIGGVKMSAFVTPAWFVEGSTGPYSFPATILSAPFQLAAGGYIGRRPYPNGQWGQEIAAQSGPRVHKKKHSRTMRRFAA